MSRKTSNNFLPGAGLLILMILSAVTTVDARLSVSTVCHRTGDGTTFTTMRPNSEGEILNHRNHEVMDRKADLFDPPGGVCPEGSSGELAATPEPITMLLFGAGLAGVGYAARRRLRREQQR